MTIFDGFVTIIFKIVFLKTFKCIVRASFQGHGIGFFLSE